VALERFLSLLRDSAVAALAQGHRDFLGFDAIVPQRHMFDVFK
jgi:hypothetical protein